MPIPRKGIFHGPDRSCRSDMGLNVFVLRFKLTAVYRDTLSKKGLTRVRCRLTGNLGRYLIENVGAKVILSFRWLRLA
jgi:hypothetical protein